MPRRNPSRTEKSAESNRKLGQTAILSYREHLLLTVFSGRTTIGFTMSADDFPVPDASTVHRVSRDQVAAGESGESKPRSDQQSGSKSLPPPAEIERADTVIRGSSRSAVKEQSWDKLDRSPAAVAKVLLGQKLNHFHLQEMIGGGGMGAVFRAHDEQLDRTVAVKVIPFVGDDPDLNRRFRNEAKSAAKLDHPNIARVFDVGNHDSWHYIVFEYISGVNIRDKVARHGVLSIDDSVFYVSQLAEAIGHAASRGIVHRDIKPSNVLICDDEQIKLVDMGLARSENFDVSEDMTASGVTLGTFDYISPEQARDPRDADVRSDIYSLGCTLYYMLTSRPPYPGGTMLQKLLSHGNAPPPDPRAVRHEVSDDLYAVIQKMLAKQPDDRYQTVADLLADLSEVAAREHLMRSLGGNSIAIHEPSPLWVWAQHHLPWVVAVALLVLSAGWLHVMSLISAQPMSVEVPGTATSVEPGMVSEPVVNLTPDSSSAEDSESTPGDSAVPADSASMTVEPARAADAPPRLSGIPVPTSLDPAETSMLEIDSEPLPFGPFGTQLLPARPGTSRVDFGETSIGSTQEPAVGIQVTRIRVLGDDVSPTEDVQPTVLETRSLPQALKLAADNGVDLIEIATPLLYSDSVVLERDSVQIRSSVGGSTIVFPPGAANDSRQPSVAFAVGSNQVDFEGLNFVWSVADNDLRGGSLFSVGENKRLRMQDCTLTIVNPARRPNVYAFDVTTASSTESAVDGELSLPLVSVGLTNVIVRGEMTMMRFDEAAELQLKWENGLLAISQCLVQTAGGKLQLGATSDRMRLFLRDVTAFTPQGLVRMKLDDRRSFPMFVDRDAERCLFVADHDQPHFEFSGLDDAATAEKLLLIHGESNVYHATSELSNSAVRLRYSSGRVTQYTLSDLFTGQPAWGRELSYHWRVRWADPNFAEVSPSEMTPSLFAQDGDLFSGFRASELPQLPIVTPESR